MDKHRLSAIKARMSAATPGPWVTDHEFGLVLPRGASRGHVIATLDHEDVCDTGGADLAFIAAAREDVKDLVAEVERLAAALDAARCEAAEAMRKKAAGLCRTVATVDPRSDVSAQYAEAWRRGAERCEAMILGSALPLDVRPGAS